MSVPNISVVIPVHNGAKTIYDCLQSVVSQHYPVLEIIVVDNNSTDGTRDKVTEFCKNNLIKYYFETRVGRGVARQRGIEIARGQIIVMIDADCRAGKNWLTNLIAPIKNGGEQLVIGSIQEMNDNYWARLDGTADEKFYFSQLENDGPYIRHMATACFAVKSALVKQLGFDENLKYFEDFDLLLRLPQEAKVFFVKDAVVYHNRKSGLVPLIKSRFWRAYWLVKIKKKYTHLDYSRYIMLKSLTLANWLTFPFWFILEIFTQQIYDIPFFILSELAWRLGVIAGYVITFNTHAEIV